MTSDLAPDPDPAGQPEDTRPPYGPPPPRPRQWGMSTVIAIVIVALLSGLGFGLHTAFTAIGRAAESAAAAPRATATPTLPRFPIPGLSPPGGSAPPVAATGPEFVTITDICALLPEKDVRKLAGPAPGAGQSERNGQTWTCARPAGRRRGQARTERVARLEVRLFPAGPRSTGAQSAADAFAQAKALQVQQPGITGLATEQDPPTDLAGIGDQAYSWYAVVETLGKTGTATVMVRVRNAIVKVEYGGHTAPVGPYGLRDYGRQRPLAEKPSRTGAEGIAQEAVRSLTACVRCVR